MCTNSVLVNPRTHIVSTEFGPRSEDEDAVILKGEATNPGPEMGTVYIPGTPGAAWTMEEVESTRLKTFQHPTLLCLNSTYIIFN